jgi:hypothetical protein
MGHVRATYGWGGDFDYPTLVARVVAFGAATRCGVRTTARDDGFDAITVVLPALVASGGYDECVVTVTPALDGAGRPEGIALSIGAPGGVTGAPVADGWTLGTGPADLAVSVELRPDGPVVTAPSATLSLTGKPATPWSLFGSPDGTRLELASAAVTVDASDGDLRFTLDVGDTAAATGLDLVVAAAESDSFLAGLLGPALRAPGAFGLTWSARDGLSLSDIGFQFDIPIEKSIGPVTVHRVGVGVTAATDLVEALLTLGLSGVIGPVSVAVDGIGLRVGVTPSTDPAALGPFALAVGLKPPDGLGIAIDAGVATGGGFLYINPPEYAGTLELSLLAVGVDAIGIVTAPPGGEWSMFLALYLSLPSIQLGFGFTLTGVGGLVGINRTLDRQALGAAVRGGQLDAVLFPADPVADAPQIISTLGAMFPPSPGRYTFGPVARISWGTPSLIDAVIGVVISLPDPVTIVVIGTVASSLPTEDVAVVALHLDVDGGVDMGTGLFFLDASLHDSSILGFALSGDMALRARFAGVPDFLMALGGFHPKFKLTMPFPTLRRLSLAVSASPVFQISFDCYFALSSNTVQFGSSFSISAEVEGFGISGGSSFDAMVTFSPFELRTSLGFHIAVTAAGIDLVGVWLDAKLTGPNPWYVSGTARFKVLGIEEHIHVDQTLGARRDEAPVEAADLRSQIRAALRWSAVDGPGSGVRLADAVPPDDTTLRAMPDAVVTVSQRVAPLGIRLDQAGDAPVDDYDTFTLDAAGLTETGAVRDWFAPARFFAMDGAESLAAPSFEELSAGIEMAGGDPVAGRDRALSQEYEEILRDPELDEDSVPGRFDPTTDTRALPLAATASRGMYAVAADTMPVAVAPDRYCVVGATSGKVLRTAGTWTVARFSDAGRTAGHVVTPSWEPVASEVAS